jgi:hypothetical protein
VPIAKLCDSKILFYISRLLGTLLKEKISGSDFSSFFTNIIKDNQYVKKSLGAGKGVKVKLRLKRRLIQ